MVLPIGEPEADAIAVASEECERRDLTPGVSAALEAHAALVCQHSRAPAGDEPAVARTAALLLSALHGLNDRSCSGRNYGTFRAIR